MYFITTLEQQVDKFNNYSDSIFFNLMFLTKNKLFILYYFTQKLKTCDYT